MLRNVLDGFKANDDIHGCIGQACGEASTMAEFQVASSVNFLRTLHRGGGNVHANNVRGDLRQKEATVALTAGDVEHAAPSTELQGKQVTVIVFEGNVTRNARHKALACPRQPFAT
jgi:hypothetical protein